MKAALRICHQLGPSLRIHSGLAGALQTKEMGLTPLGSVGSWFLYP